jgi:ribosome-associated protein
MEYEKSKTQKKREADELQKIGVSLIDWRLEKLDQLPLPASLKQAILDAKSLKSHGAMRRQAQLIGKLMRSTDLEDFLPIYHEILDEANAKTASFHHIEIWRTRLIEEGHAALSEFVDAYHPDDLQHLKQLIKKAADAHHLPSQPPAASRALFRYLRSCVK